MPLTIRWAALFILVGALFSMPTTASAQKTLTVTLDTGFSISVPQNTMPAGPIIFEVTNIDPLFTHNLRVIKTDLAPDGLPLSGSVVDEAQVNVVTSTADLAAVAGSESTPAVDLAPGNYVLICNIVGHYTSGMYLAFQVTGVVTGTPTPTNTSVAGVPPPPPVATATPGSAAVPTALPATGAASPSGSGGGWWLLALLGAAGLGLSGLALAAQRRSR